MELTEKAEQDRIMDLLMKKVKPKKPEETNFYVKLYDREERLKKLREEGYDVDNKEKNEARRFK